MAVRKIPLKEQSYLLADGSLHLNASSSNKDNVSSEDASVASFHARIRKTLLTDRALHDKVPIMSSSLCNPLITEVDYV